MHSNRLPRSYGNRSALAFDVATLNTVRNAKRARVAAAIAVLASLFAVAELTPQTVQSANASRMQSTSVPLAGPGQASTSKSADTLPNAVAQTNKELTDKTTEDYLEYSRYILN